MSRFCYFFLVCYKETINAILAIVYIMAETTTIQITTDTRDQLRELGKMGEDYNTVIRRLIAEYNLDKLIEKGEKRIKDHRDKFVDINDL